MQYKLIITHILIYKTPSGLSFWLKILERNLCEATGCSSSSRSLDVSVRIEVVLIKCPCSCSGEAGGGAGGVATSIAAPAPVLTSAYQSALLQ